MYSGPLVPQPTSAPHAIDTYTKLINKTPVFFDIATSALYVSNCFQNDILSPMCRTESLRMLPQLNQLAFHSAKPPDYRIVLDNVMKALA